MASKPLNLSLQDHILTKLKTDAAKAGLSLSAYVTLLINGNALQRPHSDAKPTGASRFPPLPDRWITQKERENPPTTKPDRAKLDEKIAERMKYLDFSSASHTAFYRDVNRMRPDEPLPDTWDEHVQISRIARGRKWPKDYNEDGTPKDPEAIARTYTLINGTDEEREAAHRRLCIEAGLIEGDDSSRASERPSNRDWDW